MTNLEDALAAVDAGADAVGFVFYEKSPRCVTVETARAIVEKLPESVETVGVFAGESLRGAEEVGHDVGFDSLQVYPLTAPKTGTAREELKQVMSSTDRRVYFALPAEKFVSPDHAIQVDIVKSAKGGSVALFLDSGSQGRPGGTGTAFNWHEAAPVVASLSRTERVVIAGGLKPENVGEAISILRPWGVDVVSGVEASPGKKDPEKVRAFVRAVRETDRRVG